MYLHSITTLYHDTTVFMPLYSIFLHLSFGSEVNNANTLNRKRPYISFIILCQYVVASLGHI